MSVGLNWQCIQCHLNRHLNVVRELGDDESRTAFTRKLLKLYLSAPENANAPWLGPATSELMHRYFGVDPDRFRQEKADSNRFILERMDTVRQAIRQAEDPVLAGLKFSILGNYLDFAALGDEVSFSALEQMLSGAQEMELDADTYRHFRQELATAGKLVYLTDNAGEIGFDRLFAEELHRTFPNLQITFCVRGGIAQNDATREDALQIGIEFPVIDNGTCIAGTQLDLIGEEARQAIAEADVIFSKGQGNLETLLGCGLNLYYAFLIKCNRFVERFGKPKLTPMFFRERS